MYRSRICKNLQYLYVENHKILRKFKEQVSKEGIYHVHGVRDYYYRDVHSS